MLGLEGSEVNEGDTMDEQQNVSGGELTAHWKGAGGERWVALQGLLDHVLQPFEDVLVSGVSPETGRVLDVGCGTGSTTVAAARRTSGCSGIDISEPMIAAARRRAERDALAVDFIVGDAQRYTFANASFDAVISRFGVMFFDDAVEAFANLHRCVTIGGALRLVVWRSADDNPFMTTAERAAAPLLPGLPVRRPDEPGQFGFADRDRVRGILEASGWAEVVIEPLDAPCTFPEDALKRYIGELGLVGRTLEQTPHLRPRVVEAIRPAFAPYVNGAEVRFVGACWLVEARRTH
jgi:SAM-dependent methyltransferase